jgi:hypothetical protein
VYYTFHAVFVEDFLAGRPESAQNVSLVVSADLPNESSRVEWVKNGLHAALEPAVNFHASRYHD